MSMNVWPSCRVLREKKLTVTAHRCELRKAWSNSEVIQLKLIQFCSKTVLWSIFEYALRLKSFYAPINVNPVGGGGVRARGGDLTKK